MLFGLHLESPSPSERRAPGEDDGEAKLPRWLEIKVLLREAAKKKKRFFGRSLPNVGGWGG